MARRRAAQQQQAQQAAQNVAQSSTTTTSATTTTTTQTVTTQTAQAAQNLARRGRAIRGPQSALTDFLASHNISANQIRLDHERRRQQAQSAPTQGQHDGDDAVAGPSSANANSTKNDDDEEDEGAKTKRTKRKLEQDKAIEKIKNSKRFQKRKKRLQDSDEEDDLIEELLRNAGPQPGQMENCMCSWPTLAQAVANLETLIRRYLQCEVHSYSLLQGRSQRWPAVHSMREGFRERPRPC